MRYEILSNGNLPLEINCMGFSKDTDVTRFCSAVGRSFYIVHM